MPWDLGWSDQWVFKVGAQVKARSDLRLRAGYNYGKMLRLREPRLPGHHGAPLDRGHRLRHWQADPCKQRSPARSQSKRDRASERRVDAAARCSASARAVSGTAPNCFDPRATL